MTSFSIQNFGCRVNQAEAFSWAEELERHGLRLAEDSTKADLVVVNTCTLTSRADRDVRKFLRRITRENPKAKLVVAGCSVESGRAKFREVPRAWLILSNKEKQHLVALVLADVEAGLPAPYQPLRSRALLKAQDGCNLHCTFCVIPRMRGSSRSMASGDILSQSRKFIKQGFREIVLCGIHLSSYGRDFEPRTSLLELLRELTGLQGLGRIRLSSLDPRFLDEKLLCFITESPKICPHFHLSLQHGSDRVLKRMGRESRVADYERLLSSLRQRSPESSLGADVIVGFPGESEEDFEMMHSFLAASPLTYFHVFSYSPRPETPAAAWAQVPGHLKQARSARLRRLSREKRTAFRQSFLGRELQGIVVKKEKSQAEVLTSNYMDILVPACPARLGEEARVKVTEVSSLQTRGEIVCAPAHI